MFPNTAWSTLSRSFTSFHESHHTISPSFCAFIVLYDNRSFVPHTDAYRE